ncbi:MAG: tRNA epoxyqueuosine(34) reductase QueG [Phycisphaerae bacterium]|nr:tRNA epoxyqueuosine(34) reductase QueG [Phycisphaerae bacterium]
MGLEQEIREKALELGFDAAGITDASPLGRGHVEHFETWLWSGYAGPMEYMHRNAGKRFDPAQLLDGARSVIVAALSYGPPVSATAVGWAPPTVPTGKVAQYAQYEDYHDFMKPLLRKLADFLQSRMDETCRFKICVDSAPLAEKALAVRAGLGFIGKNHLLIHPQLGPQVLLGELVTTAELKPDEPGRGDCGDCDLCLSACPTGALQRDGFLDTRRCISCLTQYGPPPASGDWLFGCDECLLACPHHQRAPTSANREFKRYPERARLDLQEVIEMTPETFQSRFHDSPIRQLGLDKLKDNARQCLKCRV